ncbi:FAD-binding domain-containing protein [Maribacter hydrothermalis]|uniref:Deoxyribodipyrimidine photolyase n=1 Tax=Maribacter hydrothermalis TaxID=1836467 RepID=A0A1B7ZCK0_9FLAO|nr:FAD-binding domain-containing protein [Maribacter hydrothermalis]APQ18604.1 deoxyribodipyrimidine photolyase [Maribacter hydrothermalis]OBR40840.1 deoxyribodipyrimidine photolyase [Maribacter hydrothermalis]
MKFATHTPVHFPTNFGAILNRIAAIDPINYGPTRNYIDGAVSYLSPYISRGVISTKFVYEQLLSRGFHPGPCMKFIQELAWRDYWQQVWIAKGDAINTDIKQAQTPVHTTNISSAIVHANTGIKVIDNAVDQLYTTGYIHNHLRMYLASIACNIAQNHWKTPAQWMYYYLLDADWASNALSWQWVAGANSNKKYYANQENINTFCYSNQTNTFLDVSYDEFESLDVPEILKTTEVFNCISSLPPKTNIVVNEELPTCIYNFYNLDPIWKNDISANRIFILEPSHFNQYPISKNTIDFILNLAKNITGIQIYVGEFNELLCDYKHLNIYFKEHPLNKHYNGIEEPRDWMFNVHGYYPSFFAFWKKCKKQIHF